MSGLADDFLFPFLASNVILPPYLFGVWHLASEILSIVWPPPPDFPRPLLQRNPHLNCLFRLADLVWLYLFRFTGSRKQKKKKASKKKKVIQAINCSLITCLLHFAFVVFVLCKQFFFQKSIIAEKINKFTTRN